MKLKYKLSLSIFLISIMVFILTILTFELVSNSKAITNELQTDKENTQYISDTIEREINGLVRLTQTIASAKVIEDSLVVSNDSFDSLSQQTRDETIDNLNTTWMNTDDINDPFIKSRMSNDVALFLESQQDNSPGLFGEIFLTNKYGVMISTTGKLTTLAHFEKYWWQDAYNNGDGIVYIDDRGYDDSVGGYVLGVVVPIYNNNGQIIGILKSNFNIYKIFEDSISYFREINDNGKYFIVRSLGLIVNGESIDPLSESIDSTIVPFLEYTVIVNIKHNMKGSNYLLTIVPIENTIDSSILKFGGSYDSIDHTNGNLGEIWSVVYYLDSNSVINKNKEMFTPIIYIGIIIIIINTIVALLVGSSMGKPISNLNEYILKVGSGDLTKKELKIYKDEIGDLTLSFNQMIDNLNETLTSKKELLYEKNLAQMYLDSAAVILVVINLEGNITLINKKGCEILGYKVSDDLIGKNWFDNFIPNQNQKNMIKVFNESLKGNIEFSVHYENTIIRRDGSELLISWDNTILYDIKDKIFGVLSSGEDITALRKYEEELKSIGYKDGLTGLYNKRYYKEKLADFDIIQNLPLTIVMADINGLKIINDAFGHDYGDRLLIESANLLKGSCTKNCFVFRVGGDEFVIVMPNTDEKEAEKIIDEINTKAKTINIEAIEISISFGFKTKYDISEDINEVFRFAENFMYRGKLIEKRSIGSNTIDAILNNLYKKYESCKAHSKNVSIFSERIAKVIGMNNREIKEIKIAGKLHDIGKIIIPNSIIEKCGKLTKKEYTVIKSHSETGYRILNSNIHLRNISNIVLNHHERWDGQGYPRGLKATDIPIQSRIIAIAEAFDVMTTDRIYRKKLSYDDAKQEIVNNSGTQFDPNIVKLFTENFSFIIKKVN